MIKSLKHNNICIVVQGDKKLGTCFLEQKQYIKNGRTEHLSNTRNYLQPMSTKAHNQLRGFVYKINNWLGNYRSRREGDEPVDYDCINKSELTYLRRVIKKYGMKQARIRMTEKVHKSPFRLQPIVCCARTIMNVWSKWLDY